jgi:lambda repressor-like predicted transcriptional regulator
MQRTRTAKAKPVYKPNVAVAAALEQRAWTFAEAARTTTLSPATWSNVVRGLRRPNRSSMKLIAERLGVEPEKLFGSGCMAAKLR